MKEIKKNTILFTEATGGRLLVEYLQELSQPFVICMATGYAKDLLEDIRKSDQAGCVEARQGRLDVTEMKQVFDELRPRLVTGTTCPYAVEVARNIGVVCSRRRGLQPIRRLCEPGIENSRPGMGVVHMSGTGTAHTSDVETVVTWLPSATGDILVTTNSKELNSYTRIRDYKQRVCARVLPSGEAVTRYRGLGFGGCHIIAMRRPFSEEMNLAWLKEYEYAYLVTRDGGTVGEFSEKIKTTRRAGAATVVVDRPGSEEGIPLDRIKGQLREWMDHEEEGSIYGWLETNHISGGHRNRRRGPADEPSNGLPGNGPGGDGCGPDVRQRQHVYR